MRIGAKTSKAQLVRQLRRYTPLPIFTAFFEAAPFAIDHATNETLTTRRKKCLEHLVGQAMWHVTLLCSQAGVDLANAVRSRGQLSFEECFPNCELHLD